MSNVVSWQQLAQGWEQTARSYMASVETWKKIADDRANNATMQAANRAGVVAQKTAAALATFAKRQQELELELTIAKAELRNAEQRHASEVRTAKMIHDAEMRHAMVRPDAA